MSLIRCPVLAFTKKGIGWVKKKCYSKKLINEASSAREKNLDNTNERTVIKIE